MKRNPLTKMLRSALAEYSRAESRSLSCADRHRHLAKALKIDDRARDFAIKRAARQGHWPRSADIDLLSRLNHLGPQIKRIVRASCGYAKQRRM